MDNIIELQTKAKPSPKQEDEPAKPKPMPSKVLYLGYETVQWLSKAPFEYTILANTHRSIVDDLHSAGMDIREIYAGVDMTFMIAFRLGFNGVILSSSLPKHTQVVFGYVKNKYPSIDLYYPFYDLSGEPFIGRIT